VQNSHNVQSKCSIIILSVTAVHNFFLVKQIQAHFTEAEADGGYKSDCDKGKCAEELVVAEGVVGLVLELTEVAHAVPVLVPAATVLQHLEQLLGTTIFSTNVNV
jgi:hypothetical protein